MAGTMAAAREALWALIVEAEPGQRVASVASVSAAGGGLSTAATVKVLQEAIGDGWLTSTRGPNGGYWRTSKPPHPAIAAALSALEEQLEATAQAVRVVREALREVGDGAR